MALFWTGMAILLRLLRSPRINSYNSKFLVEVERASHSSSSGTPHEHAGLFPSFNACSWMVRSPKVTCLLLMILLGEEMEWLENYEHVGRSSLDVDWRFGTERGKLGLEV